MMLAAKFASASSSSSMFSKNDDITYNELDELFLNEGIDFSLDHICIGGEIASNKCCSTSTTTTTTTRKNKDKMDSNHKNNMHHMDPAPTPLPLTFQLSSSSFGTIGGGWTSWEDRSLWAKQIYGPSTTTMTMVPPMAEATITPVAAAVEEEHPQQPCHSTMPTTPTLSSRGPSFHPVPGIDEAIPIDLNRAMSGDTFLFDPSAFVGVCSHPGAPIARSTALATTTTVPTSTAADHHHYKNHEDNDVVDDILPETVPSAISISVHVGGGRPTTPDRCSQDIYFHNNKNKNSTCTLSLPDRNDQDESSAVLTASTVASVDTQHHVKKRSFDDFHEDDDYDEDDEEDEDDDGDEDDYDDGDDDGDDDDDDDDHKSNADSIIQTMASLPVPVKKPRRTLRLTNPAANTPAATTTVGGTTTSSTTESSSESESDTTTSTSTHIANKINNYKRPPSQRFRLYQAVSFSDKLKAAKAFKLQHGHCKIPHNYAPDQELARWAKRQRYQYKLFQQKKQGDNSRSSSSKHHKKERDYKKSTMTPQRIEALEEIGFIWDAHRTVWSERYQELQEYIQVHGHSNVPSTYRKTEGKRKLSTWVKCQRRQYKLRQSGRATTMSSERIELLNKLGFEWDLAPLARKRTKTTVRQRITRTATTATGSPPEDIRPDTAVSNPYGYRPRFV